MQIMANDIYDLVVDIYSGLAFYVLLEKSRESLSHVLAYSLGFILQKLSDYLTSN